MSNDIIERAARALRNLLAEHRDDRRRSNLRGLCAMNRKTPLRSSACAGLLLAGLSSCVAPASRSEMKTYDKDYWIQQDCSKVPENLVSVCMKYHGQAGLKETVQPMERSEITEAAAQDLLDSYLAGSLKDPMSAIQYRVSGIVDCFKVSQFASVTNYAERGCLCYSINSKNSYGGYTGSEFEVMEIRQTAKDTFRLMQTQPISRASENCTMSSRNADLIRAKVQL